MDILGILVGLMANGALAQGLSPIERLVNAGKVTPEEVIACLRTSEEAPLEKQFGLSSSFGVCWSGNVLQCGFLFTFLEKEPPCYAAFSKVFRVEIETQLDIFQPTDAKVSERLERVRMEFNDTNCVVGLSKSASGCAFEKNSGLLKSIYDLKVTEGLLTRKKRGGDRERLTASQAAFQCLAFAEKLPTNYRILSLENCAGELARSCEKDADPQPCLEQVERDLQVKTDEIVALLPAEIDAEEAKAANYVNWLVWLKKGDFAADCEQTAKKEAPMDGIEMAEVALFCRALAAYVDLYAAFGLARLAGVQDHLE